MLKTYLPAQHFVRPEEKLTKEWAIEMSRYYYYHGNMVSLLHGKDVSRIELFAEGNQPMDEFRKMYKNSTKKKATTIEDENGLATVINVEREDVTGIDWDPLDLLNQPLNSAISLIHKQPIEVEATAIDGLAITKKKNDRDLIRTKAKNEKIMAPISQQLGMSGFISGPQNAAIPEAPQGLDMDDPEEQDLYFDMFYKFRPESCFETGISQLSDIQNVKAMEENEIRDQFYFGVSCHRGLVSDTTGLPYLHPYIHPKDIYVPAWARNKMFDDIDVWYQLCSYTVAEFYDAFGKEIGDENDLKVVLNTWYQGPTTPSPVDSAGNVDWGYKVQLYYFECKSVDCMTYNEYVTKSGKRVTRFAEDGKEAIYGQNTYAWYWCPGSDRADGKQQQAKNSKTGKVEGIFKLQRLGGFERKAGQEYKSSFSIRIYRSQRKSAVESCIGHIKMAQRAYIKMQHAIIRSKPPGEYVDLRFMRNAFEGLRGTDAAYTMKELLALFFHNNIYIGDSQDLPPEAMNGKPFVPIPGGISKELEGYLNVITNSIQMIGKITGINEQLTGSSANPAGLVGLQKLLINSSINALHYVTEAMIQQYTGLYNHFGWLMLAILKKGGEPAKALKAMIGERKVSILESIEEMTAHQFGIRIAIGQAEELRASLKEKLNFMMQNKLITAGNALLVERCENPKDGIAYLLLMERKQVRAEKEKQEADRQAMIQAEKIKQEGNAQLAQMDIQGKMAIIQAQAEADARLAQLAHTLQLDTGYLQGMQKKQLQDERNTAQLYKLLAGINAKVDAQARAV
jgi:hypothetical protein